MKGRDIGQVSRDGVLVLPVIGAVPVSGVRRLVPDAATVIEIGGQDSKLVRIAPDGTVRDFAMNDRCSAGS